MEGPHYSVLYYVPDITIIYYLSLTLHTDCVDIIAFAHCPNIENSTLKYGVSGIRNYFNGSCHAPWVDANEMPTFPDVNKNSLLQYIQYIFPTAGTDSEGISGLHC